LTGKTFVAIEKFFEPKFWTHGLTNTVDVTLELFWKVWLFNLPHKVLTINGHKIMY